MFLLLAIASTFTEAQQQPNIDTILSNNIILNSYIKCILETGPCNQAGKQLKGECMFNVIEDSFDSLQSVLIFFIFFIVDFIAEMIPDALQNGCSKCTAAQKINAKKVINFIRMKKPAEWKAIANKYDPTGRFHNFNFN